MSLVVVDRVLGNIASYAVEGRTVERIAIASDALAKRVLRLSTSRGELGVRVEHASLEPGDVVFADDERIVVLEVEPDDVLAIAPRSRHEAFELGHLLGNLHCPAQLGDGEVLVPYDPVIERMLVEREAAFVRTRRTLRTPFRHAHAHQHR